MSSTYSAGASIKPMVSIIDPQSMRNQMASHLAEDVCGIHIPHTSYEQINTRGMTARCICFKVAGSGLTPRCICLSVPSKSTRRPWASNAFVQALTLNRFRICTEKWRWGPCGFVCLASVSRRNSPWVEIGCWECQGPHRSEADTARPDPPSLLAHASLFHTTW